MARTIVFQVNGKPVRVRVDDPDMFFKLMRAALRGETDSD